MGTCPLTDKTCIRERATREESVYIQRKAWFLLLSAVQRADGWARGRGEGGGGGGEGEIRDLILERCCTQH